MIDAREQLSPLVFYLHVRQAEDPEGVADCMAAVMPFVYKHMASVPISDIIVTLNFIRFLPQNKALRYLKKLEDVISQGRFVLPAAHSLIKIADLFWTLDLGSRVFWARLVQELQKLIKTD